jgi:hypothetical protein
MSFAKLVPTEERDYHAGLPAPFPHDLCENLSSGNPAEPFLLDYHAQSLLHIVSAADLEAQRCEKVELTDPGPDRTNNSQTSSSATQSPETSPRETEQKDTTRKKWNSSRSR